MSLIRVGHHGRVTGHKKRAGSKKPGWDSTIHDLSVYKATREEQMERTMRHQSKNHMAVKLEKMRKENARKDKAMSPSDLRKRAILKEILYDRSQLEDVLAKSDKMMAVVKDLFGDDPKRYTGFPNVTSVPSATGDNSSVVAPVPEFYTRMDALSDTVTNPTALNEYLSSESDEDASGSEPIIYEPKMNLKRFQQFIASEEQRNQTLSSINGPNQVSHCETGPIHSTQLQDSRELLNTQDGSDFETPRRDHNESISMLRTPRSAINDTKRVKRTMKRVSPQKSSSVGGSAMKFTDFKKVLINLQEEIAEFEKQTGQCPPAEQLRSDTFSGYTVALVDAVAKLARYIRQMDLLLQGEIAVRETLTQDTHQFRVIIDSLTNDLICTQEQHAQLAGEFERHRSATSDEITALRNEVQEMRMTLNSEQHSESTRQKTPPTQYYFGPGDRNISACVGQETCVIPELIPSQNSAVLLSPVVRKTRVPEMSEVAPALQKRQTSLIDISSLAETGPHLTAVSSRPQQSVAPPTAVTVPRPQPLVQCNVGQAWQEVVPNTIQQNVTRTSQGNHSMSVSSSFTHQGVAGTCTNKNMASQIIKLNKQHEEAKRRMQSLLQHQKANYSQCQQDEQLKQNTHQRDLQMSHQQQNQQLGRLPLEQQQPQQRDLQMSHQQQIQQEQRLPSGQQQPQQRDLQMSQQHIQQEQRLPSGQQQQPVLETRQHLVDQRRLIQQPIVAQQQPHQSIVAQQQQQQPVVEQHQPQQPGIAFQQHQPQQRTQVQHHYSLHNGQQSHVEMSTDSAFRTIPSYSTEPPQMQTHTHSGDYNKNVAGVQGVSPLISPISQRSECFTQPQPVGRKDPGREITVAIPTAGMDMSGGSLPSPSQQ